MKENGTGRREFLLWSLISFLLVISGFPSGGRTRQRRGEIPPLKEARFYRRVGL